MALKTSRFKLKVRPKFEDSVLIVGLKGYGDVGWLTVRLLIEHVRAVPFASLYSPYFPDYVTVNTRGVSLLPRYMCYASTEHSPNLIILRGNIHPDPNDIPAQYIVSDMILRFASKRSCRRVITVDGYLAEPGKTGVYVAATSKKIADTLAKRCEAQIMGEGKIPGPSGLIVGLARLRGMRGVCFLGATTNQKPDREAALMVFKCLGKLIDVE